MYLIFVVLSDKQLITKICLIIWWDYIPRNGEDIFPLSHNPGQDELCRTNTFCLGNFIQLIYKFQVLVEIFLRKAWQIFACIALLKIFVFSYFTCQQSSGKWRICYDGDTE